MNIEPFYYPHIATSRTVLKASKLPEDKLLFDRAGVSEDKQRLETFARSCGGCPQDIEIVSCEEVGLQRWKDGQLMGPSFCRPKGLFCVIYTPTP